MLVEGVLIGVVGMVHNGDAIVSDILEGDHLRPPGPREVIVQVLGEVLRLRVAAGRYQSVEDLAVCQGEVVAILLKHLLDLHDEAAGLLLWPPRRVALGALMRLLLELANVVVPVLVILVFTPWRETLHSA